MRQTSSVLCGLFAGFLLCGSLWEARAADPGAEFPPASEADDQKKGSVLIFNYYTSNAFSLSTQNTRITLTNGGSSAALIHLFFVDASGSAFDTYICLTANQTAGFLASDVDPGVAGFLLAVAVGSQGEPINFNQLTGAAEIKLASGHRASLKAEAITAIANPPTTWTSGQATATLLFDGAKYNRLPRALAIDKFKSIQDGNSTILILNRITGNYASPGGLDPIGGVSGKLVSESLNTADFSLISGASQLERALSDTFPLTVPPFSTIIHAGIGGWMMLWADSDIGLLGAVISFNPNAGTSLDAYSGGHNLRKLTLSTNNGLTIPVASPAC